MKIELSLGESVEVTFKDSDGTITVRFNQSSIEVEADLPDSDGREGLIYSERFGEGIPDETSPIDWVAHFLEEGGEFQE